MIGARDAPDNYMYDHHSINDISHNFKSINDSHPLKGSLTPDSIQQCGWDGRRVVRLASEGTQETEGINAGIALCFGAKFGSIPLLGPLASMLDNVHGARSTSVVPGSAMY